uniref:CSON013734 protein n=1 Tax=Culicoides sonorensis TaxID=179676 RepID=A0A336M8L3_CULSO
MAAVQQPQRRLVHKQFNSPLGLYSQQNVQTVLDQHIKTLDNGTVGIDFKNDLSTAVPASLQKSAVLRALEEEERQKKFEPNIDRDTVLKINRRPRHRSADYVWPPRQYESSTPKINEPLRKRSKASSSSHQNINEIKDIFENHSNRSEPNTLTRLLQRKNTPSIDKNTSSTHNNNENIIDNNNRKMSLSPITTHEMEKTEDEEKICYKNIHLWPPISYNLNKSSKNWKASTQGQRIPRNDDNNEAITTKTGADDKVVEQIIKQNLYIEKNCDENLCKIECNINFHHDWHGVVPEIRNEESFTDGKRKGVKRVAWPPPPDFSEHQNHTEPSTLTEQLEHHKEHYQHLSELQNQQQHQLQQKQQQAPLYQPQATQAFRPVPAPAQAGYQPFQQKPPSPVRPRVVSQSPTNQYPGLITQLRKEAPITQQPSPVFQSQPAAATLRGGSNMRGDQKWPPVETKQQIELENEARRKLAQGPAFRPKRAQKDYTQFFAKNALNNTYPGYRVPPGTQHVGTSE